MKLVAAGSAEFAFFKLRGFWGVGSPQFLSEFSKKPQSSKDANSALPGFDLRTFLETSLSRQL